MLAIVCGQRDRFKGRLADMEAEHDRVVKQLEIARQELASFRQDNVKLYEKIRYLQSYNDSRGNRGYAFNKFHKGVAKLNFFFSLQR